jgi:hypothetical protein
MRGISSSNERRRVARASTGRPVGYRTAEAGIPSARRIGLDGVRIVRQPGKLNVEAPRYRRGAEWPPAIIFPEELSQAIAAAVFTAYDEPAPPSLRSDLI